MPRRPGNKEGYERLIEQDEKPAVLGGMARMAQAWRDMLAQADHENKWLTQHVRQDQTPGTKQL